MSIGIDKMKRGVSLLGKLILLELMLSVIFVVLASDRERVFSWSWGWTNYFLGDKRHSLFCY